jgi:hypothetical protein
MAKIDLFHYSSPDFLRKLNPASLRMFLGGYGKFLEENGIRVVVGEGIDDEEFDKLAELFCSPPPEMPSELLEEVWMLEALTTKKGYEELTTNHADAVADVIRPGDSAGDVVMRLLLKHPNTVETAYSRFCLNDRRQLHCFKAAKKFNFTEPSEEDWNEIEKDLALEFFELFNNNAVRVSWFREPERIAMVIRRGDMIEHIGVFDDENKPQTRLIRPLKHDVAYLLPDRGEFLCTGRAGMIREKYRTVFSQHIFKDVDALEPARRLTLAPLRTGRACLQLAEIGKSYTASLTEVQLKHEMNQGTTTFRYGDVFKVLEGHGTRYLDEFIMVSARFLIRIGQQKIRLEVNPGKDTLGGDKNDPIAISWLKGCGFLVSDTIE